MIIEIYSDQFNVVGGGGQHRMLMVAKGLHELGYNVVLITPYYRVTYEELIREPLKYSVSLNWLYYTWHGKIHYYIDNTVVLPLKSLVSDSPAIVVLPSPLMKGGVAFAKRLIRKAATILDFGDIWFTDRDSVFYKIISSEYLKRLLKVSCRVVLPTRRFMAFFNHVFPNFKSKCIHIPSSIDTALFKPLHKKSATPTVVYVGSLSAGRGVELLPQIISKTTKLVNDIKFLIVGSGPLKSWLEKECIRLQIDRYVKFIGDLEFNEIPSVVGQGWVGLSLYPRETLCPVDVLKSLVYMSLGMPIISSTIIEEAEGVLIHVHHNADAFARAIHKLLADDFLLEELSKRAREKAIKEFDLKTIAAKYDLIIKECV